MSADNGIYIGIFPTTDGGKEYRVIEASAIDNVNCGTEEYQDHMRLLYFGKAKSLPGFVSAITEAFKLKEEYPILEYGINELEFDRPLLNKTIEEAQKWIKQANKAWALSHGKTPCANPDCSSFTTLNAGEKGPWYCSDNCVVSVVVNS